MSIPSLNTELTQFEALNTELTQLKERFRFTGRTRCLQKELENFKERLLKETQKSHLKDVPWRLGSLLLEFQAAELHVSSLDELEKEYTRIEEAAQGKIIPQLKEDFRQLLLEILIWNYNSDRVDTGSRERIRKLYESVTEISKRKVSLKNINLEDMARHHAKEIAYGSTAYLISYFTGCFPWFFSFLIGGSVTVSAISAREEPIFFLPVQPETRPETRPLDDEKEREFCRRRATPTQE